MFRGGKGQPRPPGEGSSRGASQHRSIKARTARVALDLPALRCAIDSFGADRLLLGTDFPYENGDTFIRAVDYINDPQIGTNAARAILDQNASALLGIGQERPARDSGNSL